MGLSQPPHHHEKRRVVRCFSSSNIDSLIITVPKTMVLRNGFLIPSKISRNLFKIVNEMELLLSLIQSGI